MPLLCGLKNHDIIGSALTGGRLLIVNLIEQGYTLVAGTSIIFRLFRVYWQWGSMVLL
jgi:hypothetical protein